MQLDSGEPNTLGSSITLSNSIPYVSNYLFIMGEPAHQEGERLGHRLVN